MFAKDKKWQETPLEECGLLPFCTIYNEFILLYI